MYIVDCVVIVVYVTVVVIVVVVVVVVVVVLLSYLVFLLFLLLFFIQDVPCEVSPKLYIDFFLFVYGIIFMTIMKPI